MRELEQGLLAVDDIQVVDIGLQLLLLLWRHVASKLVSPAVSQGSDSICDHVQLFKIDEIIQECFISFMNKCYISQVCDSRLTEAVLRPITMAKKEFRFCWALQ